MSKKECACCHNLYNSNKLHKHYSGELRCRRCMIKYGNNKFYIPKIKGQKIERKFIKMTMSQDEKQELWTSLVKTGLSEQQASMRVRQTQHHLFNQQRRRMFRPKEQEADDINKKFIEGLKNAG